MAQSLRAPSVAPQRPAGVQLKFLRRIEYLMQGAGELPKLPKVRAAPSSWARPRPWPGPLEAPRLRQMINELGPQVGAAVMAPQRGELIDRLAASGIDTDGLIKSEAQFQQGRLNSRTCRRCGMARTRSTQSAAWRSRSSRATEDPRRSPRQRPISSPPLHNRNPWQTDSYRQQLGPDPSRRRPQRGRIAAAKDAVSR